MQNLKLSNHETIHFLDNRINIITSVRWLQITPLLPDNIRSPRIARRAINGHTLASRRLGGHAYWAIFRNRSCYVSCKITVRKPRIPTRARTTAPRKARRGPPTNEPTPSPSVTPPFHAHRLQRIPKDSAVPRSKTEHRACALRTASVARTHSTLHA